MKGFMQLAYFLYLVRNDWFGYRSFKAPYGTLLGLRGLSYLVTDTEVLTLNGIVGQDRKSILFHKNLFPSILAITDIVRPCYELTRDTNSYRLTEINDLVLSLDETPLIKGHFRNDLWTLEAIQYNHEWLKELV